MADALVDTGLAALGFTQLNIDSGYLLRDRDARGVLQVDPSKFPHGMRSISDYLAVRGIGLGLYTDITNHTCGPDLGGPGSWGHYAQDAASFAEWNITYLKVDMCSADIGIDPASQLLHWGQFRDALNATGHRIWYSICPHSHVPSTGPSAWWYKGGKGYVYAPPLSWTAADRRGLANSLLVEYTNLFDFWYSPHWLSFENCPGPECNTSSPGGFLTNVDAMVQLTKPEFSGPGSWADGDMLQVCNFGEGGVHAGGRGDGGMTIGEYRASLSVYAVMASPIIISADLRTLARRHPECLAMLKASNEVIAISQDPLGRPGRLVRQDTNASNQQAPATTTTITAQIWVRQLESGGVAAVLFNRAEHEVQLTLTWTAAGIAGTYAVRDVWAKAELGIRVGSFTASVKPHEATVVRLRPLRGMEHGAL